MNAPVGTAAHVGVADDVTIRGHMPRTVGVDREQRS